ncbi:inovirus-type Gp2 protein [Acinetobacter tibetensis]|uniref:YagK/YfjJ domain-containing protein n=1 Tax=Acinetobacter tibetensis TaxID=2943497 RepID=UPI003A4E3C70
MSIIENEIVRWSVFESAYRPESLMPISRDEEQVVESSDKPEEESSEYEDEVNEFLKLIDYRNSEIKYDHELPSVTTINQHLINWSDPEILACTIAISLCEEISEQGTTYVYSWIQSQSEEQIPDHWELMYPKIRQLIRRFILALKQLKSPMKLRCEQFDAVMVILNRVLRPYLDCIYDLILHPYEVLNEINENGIPTGRRWPIADIINRFVKQLYDYLYSREYLGRVNDRRKMARRREKNVLRYINKLRKFYARLLGVRVDLYLPTDKKHFTHKEIVEHFHKILQKVRRNKSLHLAGYVSKLEYGVDQALHIHCFFFFDKNKHRQDISLGRMIGEMWDSQIGGKHNYFNCNTSKNRKKYKYDALGEINSNDQSKYDNIAKVIHYFAKFEQYVLYSSLERVKTLNTGVSPHLRDRMGRPNLTKHY